MDRPRYALTGAETAYVAMAVRLRSAIADAAIDEQVAIWACRFDDLRDNEITRIQMAATEIWKRMLPDFRSGSSAGSASPAGGGVFPVASSGADSAAGSAPAPNSGTSGTAERAGTGGSSRERRRY